MRGSIGKVYQKKLFVKKRKRAAFIGLYVLLGAGILFSGLSFLSQSDSLAIKYISVIGTGPRGAASIEAAVLEGISGNFMSFFSRGNVLIYPASHIRERIVALPFVQTAEVEREGRNAIKVTLEERKESARWCDDACYSVDENGFVFDRVATSSAFIYRGLLSGNVLGREILTRDEFKKIQFFIRELGRLGLSPMEASLDETNYMKVKLFSGGTIIVRKDEDLSVALANIASIFADKSVVPSVSVFLESLDYMKLDSGNKVVYKLR